MGVVTLKSLGRVFALEIFPIRKQITMSTLFSATYNLIGDLFVLPCILHVSWINYLTWLINWLIHYKGSIHSWPIIYVLNIHAIFHINWILFTIRSINSSFMHYFKLQNLKFKQLIDEMTINLWSLWNFASMKNIRR